MPDRSLVQRIHSDPAYRDVIKLVTYRGMATPMKEEDYKRFVEKYGKDRFTRASEALVDIDAEKKIATLKVEVRTHCQAILGPAPEAWEEFYAGIVNPPPNPYRGEREEIDVVAEAVATAIEQETRMWCEVRGEPPPPSPDADKQPTELDEIRQTYGRRLRQLLVAEHDRFQQLAPSESEHQEAVRRMDLIESEMRRRGNKVPSRPAWREPYHTPAIDQLPEAVADAIPEESDMDAEVRAPEGLGSSANPGGPGPNNCRRPARLRGHYQSN